MHKYYYRACMACILYYIMNSASGRIVIFKIRNRCMLLMKIGYLFFLAHSKRKTSPLEKSIKMLPCSIVAHFENQVYARSLTIMTAA